MARAWVCAASPPAEPHVRAQVRSGTSWVTGVHGLRSIAPQREMSLPAQEGSQLRACPGTVLLRYAEDALHPLESLGNLQTSLEELRGKHSSDRSPWGIHSGCPETLLLSPTCLCQVLDLRGGTRWWCHI